MKQFLSFCVLFLYLSSCLGIQRGQNLRIWFDKPADNWDEAIPIGNGRAGAMIYGGIEEDHLQLNENTLYSGEPSLAYKDVKITPEMLDKVVGLIRSEEYIEATELIRKNWLARLHHNYQPFGDLLIKSKLVGEASEYTRSVNLSDAMAETMFEQGGIRIKKEYFASHADDVIVFKLESSAPEGIDILLEFTSIHPTAIQKAAADRLVLHGQAPGYVERRTFEQMESWGDTHKHPELYDAQGHRKYNKRLLYGNEVDNKGMFFEAQLKPFMKQGSCEITDDGIHVSGTDEVYFILSLATSFNGYDKSPSREGIDASAKAASILDKAAAHSYRELKHRHVTDYRALFDRVSLRLKSSPEQKSLPIDRRIEAFKNRQDPDLAALEFQFGRYLMISGSRPGGQPLNLQGIWNQDSIPAWNCGYTLNINAEMNYWPAEVTNLSECAEPFFDMIGELAESGAETARNMYGRRGWVAHHNCSIWRESVPNDGGPGAAYWPMAEGWLSSHLWEHYLFTGDEDFLREKAYPIMKGAAEFLSDWLIEDSDGHLVTAVGTSPENTFIAPNGQHASMSSGSTMDMTIVRELFSRVIAASEILNTDRQFKAELQEKYVRLLPFKVGSRGQLQEWARDFQEADPQHRHFSHLYGLYPGDQITPDRTPELFDAARKTLEIRGDFATGWSMGWKINCWARLLDGNHANKIITNFFNPVGFGEIMYTGGGVFKNMLCAHPPFQIDGNFGFTAGVAEMLMQSHAGFIHLLPALPDAWPDGKISGLRARGNFEVSINWRKGRMTGATLVSVTGNPCLLRAAQPFIVRASGRVIAESTPVVSNNVTYYQASFETSAGKKYKIIRSNKPGQS